MQVYTTDSIDRHRRMDFWSSLSSNHIAPMLISADRRAPFEGRLWVDRLGPIGLARAYSSGVVIQRTGQRPHAGSGANAFSDSRLGILPRRP